MGGAIGDRHRALPVQHYVDPPPRKVVFEAGVPLVMHGLDVTHQALVTPDRLEAIRQIGTPLSGTVVELLEFYNGYDPDPAQAGRCPPARPLRDRVPFAAGIVPRPPMPCGDRDQGRAHAGPHRGRLVGAYARPPNATVIHEIDADGFFALLTERLGRLPLAPPKAVNPGRGDERLPSILDTHSGVADDWRAAGQRTCGLTWRYAPSLDHLCLPCG